MTQTELTKDLSKRYSKLKGQRSYWETHWQEVAD